MSSKPCVYISGPMTGYPEFNVPAFHDAANGLRFMGFPVINPADFGFKDGETWASCLKRDIIALCNGVDVVLPLDGWQKSKGASLEIHVAKALGIPVVGFARILAGKLTEDEA